MLHSIPPNVSTSRNPRNRIRSMPDARFRFVGSHSGIGSGQPRISNETKYDRWTVGEHKKGKPVKKTIPKVVIRPENGKVAVEIHDNGDHYQVISNGKPSGLGIENLIRALSPFGIAQELLNNGIWQAVVKK